LFNRGNSDAQECPFTLRQKINQEFSLFKRLQAPKMKGVRTCFTDAVLVDEKFISWLQKTLLMNDDEILGSLGRIDIETMKIDFTKISPKINLKG
jgi:hypothetical protein